VRIRPAGESFVPNFVPGPDCGLVCPVLSSRARACRGNHQAPRVSLPEVGVTFIRETCTVSSEDIPPRSSLLQTHSPIPSSSPLLWFIASFEESLQVAAGPCCSWDLPDAIPQFFPQMPGPPSRRSHRVHLPVSSSMSSAFPRTLLRSASRFVREHDFSAVKFRDCPRTFLAFKPPSLLVSPIAPTAANCAGRPRLLLPGRTCFVASARPGYAIRPFQAIDGERTFTFPDLRHCRLLRGSTSISRTA
jgi:hypothetical protein